MKTEAVKNINFKGSVIIEDNLSPKPKKNINKIKKHLQDLVSGKDYDLYLKQDYQKNVINIELKQAFYSDWYKQHVANDTGLSTNVNITACSSKYTDAAKKVISDYKLKKAEKLIQQDKIEDRKRVLKDFSCALAGILIMPVLMMHKGMLQVLKDAKKVLNKLENKANKVAEKKG